MTQEGQIRTALTQDAPGASPKGGRTYGMTNRNAKYGTVTLTVPIAIARVIPDGTRFSCELTDDGILFRPVTATRLPEWVK